MSHDHNHAPANFGKAFAIGITLTAVFVLIEAFYAWQAGSRALLADAAHNLSDVGGLLLAWAAFAAARLKPNPRHTYGWRRGSILASFANSILLLVVLGTWSLFHRSLHLLFDGVPDGIDVAAVRQSLLDFAGVVAVHDLHIWAMSTADNALTAHLVIDAGAVDRDTLLQKAVAVMHEQFELRYVALQCEPQAFAKQCPLNEAC
jgi:Co/Zn/Cd efflux system component